MHHSNNNEAKEVDVSAGVAREDDTIAETGLAPARRDDIIRVEWGPRRKTFTRLHTALSFSSISFSPPPLWDANLIHNQPKIT